MSCHGCGHSSPNNCLARTLLTEMGMAQAFSSYFRSVAVIFACAFAVFFAQESQSELVLVLGALIGGVAALVLWFRLRGTQYRFFGRGCSCGCGHAPHVPDK